jgi:predicted Zn-dependent protease
VALLVERLDDPVRGIRVAAAGLLLGRSQGLDAAAARALVRALGEYEAAQRENADRPEGLINLARLALHRGRSDEAEHLLRLAATRHRGFVPAHLALAEILRRRGGEAAAAAVLDDALRAVPGEPALREAQAQALVRQRRSAEAEALLAELAKAGTASATGVLLHAQLIAERGDLAAAGGALDGARARLGGRRELLLSLAALQVRQGQGEAARATLDALARINPDDPALPRRP